MPTLTRDEFVEFVTAQRRAAADDRGLLVPIGLRLLSDQLTPVLAYRRLVAPDERTAPSFLLESVEGGDRQGRHSILGARPRLEVVARGRNVVITDHRAGSKRAIEADDPMSVLRTEPAPARFVRPPTPPGASSGGRSLLPECVLGGWFGYAAYDTVRYAEPDKLDPAKAPPDDRDLPDLHFGFYDRIAIFDHVDKLVHLVRLVRIGADADPGAQYDEAVADLEDFATMIQTHSKPLPLGRVDRVAPDAPAPMERITSNLTRAEHAAMLERAKEYIRAGDIFQVVLGQRFERQSPADPFDVYRALRAVNPSPYMVYMQAAGCILVASSPEILCRVRRDARTGRSVVTNRPLAGTRKRGGTPEEDAALASELLADEKERAEHIMLVDLGRNDVGKVCEAGTIELPAVMEIERYSHVMHISSTVTGLLREEFDCWDALRAALPVGTISGAPKIRAMQIIDELEPVRRGPYGGGMGYVSPDGDMDIALALRTMVVPTALHAGGAWTYHIQAAGGIVADSQPEAEFQETVNKAAALAAAIDLAERAFAHGR
ncbi:MAG: anthranilate synthase component I [Phycisphaeraceae bacterium]|nr:MAG: anthranilate synthase component I [Phycisphaeraceae bacterium]